MNAGSAGPAWRYAAGRCSRAQVDLTFFSPVAKTVYLHDVNVDPPVQRTGIGRELIERAKRVAREWPVEAIRLDAFDGPSGGGPFYRKCGFTEVGRAVYRGVPLNYFEFLVPTDPPSFLN